MKRKLVAIGLVFLGIAPVVPFAFAKMENKAQMAQEAKITMAEARKTALARVPGNIEEGKLEREKGKLWFEFEIYKAGSNAEVSIHIDAVTGEVGETETEDEGGSGSAQETEMFSQAKVSWDDAEQAALKRVPGTVVTAKLERERGKVIYEFEIVGSNNQDSEVSVDAASGAVENVER